MITAQVVLINKEGLVLGVSRKNDHNDFGLPGGKAEPTDGNATMMTAYRETLEETGLRISNLKLVFAIHKDGNMSYTYLADYDGEIKHNEPHIVKWVPFDVLIKGSFGKYNKLVSESLDDMGIVYQKSINVEALTIEIKEYLRTHIRKEFIKPFALDHIDIEKGYIYLEGDYEEAFDDYDTEYQNGLNIIAKKYFVSLKFPYWYWTK